MKQMKLILMKHFNSLYSKTQHIYIKKVFMSCIHSFFILRLQNLLYISHLQVSEQLHFPCSVAMYGWWLLY